MHLPRPCRFLLEPLEKLDAGKSRVLILLDAMDESDDSSKGWEPVTLLVANE